MSLRSYSDEQLLAEVERRKKAKLKKPSPKIVPDWKPLEKMVIEYIEFVDSNGFHEDNDYTYYIAEAAVECVYGERIWEWMRERRR